MLVRADNGAVHKDIFEIGVICHCIEKAIKYAVTAPSVATDVDRIPFAKGLG